MCFRTHAVSISPSLSLLIGLLISLRNIIRIQSLSLFDARDGVRPLFLFNPLLRNVSACDSTSTQKPFKRGGYVVLLNSKVLRSVLQDTRNTGEEVPMDYASTSTIWNTNVRRRWHIWLNRQWKILDSWERTVFFFHFSQWEERIQLVLWAVFVYFWLLSCPCPAKRGTIYGSALVRRASPESFFFSFFELRASPESLEH